MHIIQEVVYGRCLTKYDRLVLPKWAISRYVSIARIDKVEGIKFLTVHIGQLKCIGVTSNTGDYKVRVGFHEIIEKLLSTRPFLVLFDRFYLHLLYWYNFVFEHSFTRAYKATNL